MVLRGNDNDTWMFSGSSVVTYREMRSNVTSLSLKLAGSGIGHGSTVAICVTPSRTLLYAMLAAWMRGAQITLIDIRSTSFEVARILDAVQPQHIISTNDHSQDSSFMLESVPLRLERRRSGREATTDAVLVQTTSGSTGQPKITGRNPGSILSELQRYALLDGMPRYGDRVVLLNSIIHTMGLVGGVLHGLNSGAQMIYPSKMRAGTILDVARATQATAIFGVPLNFALLARFGDSSIPSLRLAVSAGEQLPLTVWSNFKRAYGIPVSPIYGTTETGIISADLSNGCMPPAIGWATDGLDVDIDNGELRVRLEQTPYILSDRPDRFEDGWFRTFDRCAQDAHTGIIRYKGRSDSVVTIGGLKVDLAEIEQILLKHPSIREAVVISSDGIEAYVGGDLELSPASVMNWCKIYLSRHKIPKTFSVASALPRNANGKLLRSATALKQHDWYTK